MSDRIVTLRCPHHPNYKALKQPTSTKPGCVCREVFRSAQAIHEHRLALEAASKQVWFYCDNARHLVCTPYSIENLHAMAAKLGIKRSWFHKDHYDIPKSRIAEIKASCTEVCSRDIVRIVKGTYSRPTSLVCS